VRASVWPAAIRSVWSAESADHFIVTDCLTLWVSHLFMAGVEEGVIQQAARNVAIELQRRRGVVVSNEVGLGVRPAYELGRRFLRSHGLAAARPSQQQDLSHLEIDPPTRADASIVGVAHLDHLGHCVRDLD